MPKPDVVLIAGAAHGGTTIASMVLGQHPEVLAVGKLRDFPHGSVFEDENVCSCGIRAADCSFWTEVRRRYLPFQEQPEAERLPQLYRIISELSGRRFVVDATHAVRDVERLERVAGIDLRLVHVVRDGRAVVYSRIRKDVRIGRLARFGWGRVSRVAKVASRWQDQSRRLTEFERRLGPRAIRLGYEDLCRDPASVLERVGAFVGLDFRAIGDWLATGRPLARLPHLIRGNANLRQQQEVFLRLDDAYARGMTLLDRGVFCLACSAGFARGGGGSAP